MPMYNGNYVAPVWINNVPPAINDTELLAISRTLQNSQIITGSGAPTQYTSGVAGQRYADTSTTPYTIYKLVTAAEDANVWTVDADANGNLALDYNPSSTYKEGQYCIYQGKLYKANQDIDPGEAWTEAHWTQAYLADDVADNAAEIAGHIADTDNPHSVTAAQAGALGISSVATVETGTASKNYAVGGLMLIGSTLYKATAPIAQGDTLTVGTNIAAATVEELLAAKQDTLTFDLAPTENSLNPVTSGGVYTALAGKTDNETIAPVEESTTATGNYAVGDLLIQGGILYEATSAIAIGDTITPGTNVAAKTVAELLDGQAVKKGTVSISAAWSGTGPYTQTVTVTGVSITSNSMVDLQPTAAQIAALADDNITAIVIENNAGILTAYAVGGVTAASMTIDCTVTEVRA